MSRNLMKSLLGAVVLAAGCVGGTPTDTNGSDLTGGGEQVASGGESNTFDHDFNDTRDPFDILQQKQQEGSPLVATRLHSCQKLTYASLGSILKARGVNLAAKASNGMPPTAGQLYMSGANALGAPNYLGRTREPTQNTAAGATKLMDVFVQAAPEIIAAMPNLKECQTNGTPATMFNMDGSCNITGVSCLMGAPATQAHVQLCSQAVKDASTPQVGQNLAVAVILAAAHTCQ